MENRNTITNDFRDRTLGSINLSSEAADKTRILSLLALLNVSNLQLAGDIGYKFSIIKTLYEELHQEFREDEKPEAERLFNAIKEDIGQYSMLSSTRDPADEHNAQNHFREIEDNMEILNLLLRKEAHRQINKKEEK